ncbi:MAG: hypothetical protein LBI91_01435 [Spirochaetaceae bacterium]|jgi:hypothetical protein|nr:hypothetical protein [Spirochaetaceae bacterium]
MFGIGNRDKSQDPAEFWREYGARYGETVQAYGLGRYISGWAEFQDTLWGLLIATTGGFRFHHFPHEGWIQALSRVSFGGNAPKEKTLFIPHERILGVDLRVEKSWWKRFLNPSLPRVLIRYRPDGATEQGEPGGEGQSGDTLVIEADQNASTIIRHLAKPAIA